MRAGLATCLRRGERSGPGRWSTTKNGRTAAWDTGHRGSSREKWRQTAVEKELGGTPWKTGFPPSLEIPQRARNSHFPTASSAVLPPLKRTQKKSGKSYDHVRRVWGQVSRERAKGIVRVQRPCAHAPAHGNQPLAAEVHRGPHVSNRSTRGQRDRKKIAVMRRRVPRRPGVKGKGP